MAAARRPPPIFLLSNNVDMYMGGSTYEPEPGDGWKKMECASKRAYGCGHHGEEAVQGLALYAVLGEDQLLTSSLAIRMTDEAFRRFDSELQLTCRLEDVDGRMIAAGFVQMADEQGLTVILLTFRRQFCRDLAYYLVYDHATASLSLIQLVPDLSKAICASQPVAKRNGSGDFELFVMASEGFPVPRRFLCACTPETRANQAPDGPWLINKPFEHEEFKEPFIVDVAFTFQSKGIWGDLSRGLICCDLDTTMDFGFIGLPRECLLDSDDDKVEFDETTAKVTRTMSCVGGAICFVCIDLHATDPKDDLVKTWALKGNFKNPRWEKTGEVRASEIWGFDGFDEARLPRAPLEYPLLMADGALCVVLADQNKIQRNKYRGPVENDICIFDMSLRRLQWHGSAHRHLFWSSLVISSEASMVDASASSTNAILQQQGSRH